MDSQMINIDWHGQDASNGKAPVYREALEIASHEIGHVFGLDDVDEGDLGDGRYELMRGDSYLPSLSLFNRMKLGLLEEVWIKRITLPVDETFYLDPLRGLRPSDPRASTGLVLDLLDSFKVLIEYRAMPEPDKKISDLEQKSGAVLAYLYDESDRCGSASTPLRLLSTDGGKWCVLEKEGDSFTVALKAADQSVLGRPTELTIECVPWVEGEVKPSPSTVKVRVEAGPGGPNPYMTKCPGGMTWQSPDIEIRNERNAQDPQYKNLPWADHDNEIVATVHNSGSEDAPQVWVDFFCKEYTLQVDGGGAGEIKIGEAVQDVPARGHAEFHCPWHPEKAGNESVIVRIRSYVSPVSGVPELSSSDNCACSNYAEFISASGSPFGLARSSVRVANHKDEAADFFLQQYQDNESFVTFLGSSRLSMEPGERTSVDLMFKRDKGPTKDGPLGREEGINNVALVAWKEVDEAKGPRRPEIIGGVQARVFSGKATRFYTLRVDQIRRWIKFAVVDSNGKAVTGGKVILTFRDLPGDNKKEKYLTCTLDSQGMGSAELPCPRGRVQGYYLAGPGYTECYSQWIELRGK
jgi:hypothetical protein